jgi:hypothetical protein
MANYASFSDRNFLVLRQANIDGFRATQMVQDKTQFAGNGKVLFKDCNAVLGHLGSSLRASREAVVRGVAPLGKDAPLPARRAWRPTASRLAEPTNISLTEHLSE